MPVWGSRRICSQFGTCLLSWSGTSHAFWLFAATTKIHHIIHYSGESNSQCIYTRTHHHHLISEKSFECGRFTEIIKGQTAAFITFVLVPIANCQYGRVQRHFGVD